MLGLGAMIAELFCLGLMFAFTITGKGAPYWWLAYFGGLVLGLIIKG